MSIVADTYTVDAGFQELDTVPASSLDLEPEQVGYEVQ